MKIFYLIGLMGSGKSHIMPIIAQEFGLGKIDLDAYLVAQEKTSIQNIFIQKGEDYFRKIEHEAIKKISQQKNIVVACGGGTPCFYDNMQILNSTGITIWLKISAEVIFQRLKTTKTHRPLLNNKTDKELFEFITTQLKEREKFYNQSKVVVTESENTLEQLKEFL